MKIYTKEEISVKRKSARQKKQRLLKIVNQLNYKVRKLNKEIDELNSLSENQGKLWQEEK